MEIVAGIISISLLTSLAIFQIALAFGLKQGDMIMGGRYPKELPKKVRTLSAIASVTLACAASIFAIKSEIVNIDISKQLVNALIIFFTAYLGLNTIGNLFSKSKKEKVIMSPISFAIFICGIVIIF